MSRLSAAAVLVVVTLAASALGSVPAPATEIQGSRAHRLVPHRVVRSPAGRSRLLTVRRPGRAPVTRDFDPVPLGGGPIANLVRDVEEVYGHDLPLGPIPPFQPRVFRDF